jgi:hypothetical protein
MWLKICLQLVILVGCGCRAGDVVWQAVLTLVLMNPRKNKGGSKKVRRLSRALCSISESSSCSIWHVPLPVPAVLYMRLGRGGLDRGNTAFGVPLQQAGDP